MPATMEPDMVDLQFVLSGRAIPTDYADLLCGAVQRVLPWLASETTAGIHPVSGLSPAAEGWYLSRRARLTLRLPRGRLADATVLTGSHLQLLDHVVEVGAGVLRELMPAQVINAKFITFDPAGAANAAMSEALFLETCQAHFAALGIRPQMVSGKSRRARTADGWLAGFSLLLAGLDAATALYLQRVGIGLERQRGCGLFIPHKSLAAVDG